MFGSGSTQAQASQSGPFCFGMPFSGIPSFSFSTATAASTPMSSMASGSASFQGFPFGSGHIPNPNPSLGSFPFTSQTQSSTTFTGWNPVFTAVGAGNQFLASQQGNASFPSSSAYQTFSPPSSAWNPYQGVSSLFTTSGGGTDPVYGNSTLGGGPSPNAGSQGSSYGTTFSTISFWKPGAS